MEVPKEIITELDNDMKHIIMEIKKCKSNSKYFCLLTDYEVLEHVCYTIGYKDYPKVEDYCHNNFKYENKSLNDNMGMFILDWNYHTSFLKNINKIDLKKYENKSLYYVKVPVSFMENIDYLKDFLNSYGKKYSDTFMKAIRDERILITDYQECPDKTIAYVTPSFGNYKPYLVLYETNSILEYINLAHEISHYYDMCHSMYDSSKIFNNKNCSYFDEVKSHFIQLCSIDHIKDIPYLKKDIENAYNIVNWALVYHLKKSQSLLNKINKSYFDVSELIKYAYGINIAYCFYDKYLIDKEGTKEMVEDFEYLSGYLKPMELLEKFALKDELLEGKILKKYLNR